MNGSRIMSILTQYSSSLLEELEEKGAQLGRVPRAQKRSHGRLPKSAEHFVDVTVRVTTDEGANVASALGVVAQVQQLLEGPGTTIRAPRPAPLIPGGRRAACELESLVDEGLGDTVEVAADLTDLAHLSGVAEDSLLLRLRMADGVQETCEDLDKELVGQQ